MSTPYPQIGTRGTGRRKRGRARVRLLPGTGVVLVNGHTLEDYFGKRPAVHLRVIQPLISADVKERYDILCKAEGGGKIGQADAIRMGIARSLAELNPEFALLMRREGFLTRDSREKESKKYGRKKARKRFQFSKR